VPHQERLTSYVYVSLETEEDVEAAVKFFNDAIQWGVGMQCHNIQKHSRHMTAPY
jgi:hypothetical protein